MGAKTSQPSQEHNNTEDVDLDQQIITVTMKEAQEKLSFVLPSFDYIPEMNEREMIGDLWKGGEHNFVFCHPDGKSFHQERPYLWFRNFLKKNKLMYITFHTLRHTSATILINQGVHAKLISQHLGHGNINTTMNVYGHALRSADQSAADKFESIFHDKPLLKSSAS